MAIANRAVSACPIGLGVFANSANTFDLAFTRKKINTKCKSLGYGLGALAGAYRPPYLPSRAVVANAENLITALNFHLEKSKL